MQMMYQMMMAKEVVYHCHPGLEPPCQQTRWIILVSSDRVTYIALIVMEESRRMPMRGMERYILDCRRNMSVHEATME